MAGEQSAIEMHPHSSVVRVRTRRGVRIAGIGLPLDSTLCLSEEKIMSHCASGVSIAAFSGFLRLSHLDWGCKNPHVDASVCFAPVRGFVGELSSAGRNGIIVF